MNDSSGGRDEPIPFWRARAWLGGNGWTDSAYGFGGPDVAEAAGSPEALSTELTNFLDGLGRPEVAAERHRTGRFFVRLELEPHMANSTLTDRRSEIPTEDRVLLWKASASVGNAGGVFDVCYSYGNTKDEEGHLVGTAQEVGTELTRILNLLTRQEVEAMKYGTERFFLELVVELPSLP